MRAEIRLRQVQFVHHLEVRGLKNLDLGPELVQKLSIGRNFKGKTIGSFVLDRHVRGLDDLLLLQVDHRVLGVLYVEVFGKLVDLPRHRVE